MFDCVMAGFGGQGILSAGMMLSYVAAGEDKHVTWFPSYGAEQRGGTANCTVVVDDEPIGSPIVTRPSYGIIMNMPSFDKFEPRFAENANAILDTSLVDGKSQFRDDVAHYGISASNIAKELGNIKVANMVMIGALMKVSGLFSLETAMKYLKQAIPEKHHRLIPMNEEAMTRGFNEVVRL